MKYIRQFDGEPIVWETRTAEIKQGSEIVFKQENVRVPSTWSQLATNIAASKYLYGKLNTSERETGVDQLVARVADTISEWGLEDGYFEAYDAQAFNDDLTWLLLHQYCAFNSPVWFNCGLFQKYGATADPGNWYWDKKTNRIKEAQNPLEFPQISACFIQGVEDNMDSIMNLARSDAMLFKFGSGSGTNLSPLRASCEGLTGGGHSSGPLSFMRIYDQVAETVTSGGRVRRAALLHCLDVDHPDIDKFISCKAEEESHARMLIDRGVTPERAAKSVMYQNMNISVQVSDAFMQAVENNEDWVTKWVTTGQDGPVFKARDLWKKIAESTWLCGDPGLQFSDTTNSYNTIPHVGRVVASNPCAEYLSINSSACNLASINLLKFLKDGKFDYETFQKVVRILLIAQDILVDRASYPLKDIARNAHRCRQLGLGYTNLGALIMSLGLPYDSDEARNLCGCISAILTARAYLTSSELANELGAFEDYNDANMLEVLNKHTDYTGGLNGEAGNLARDLWDEVMLCKEFRNSQTTLAAPTGTISFLMDCDTTGIEPELALVKTKTLVGGGVLKLANKSVEAGLKALGISDQLTASILNYLEKNQTLVGSYLTEDETKVFATSLGDNQIPWEAHIKMMAASQPFLSGGISKTVNLPANSTVEDIQAAYMLGWKLGLKSVAIYRDGSKGAQPLNTKKLEIKQSGSRQRLPDTRESITHKFTIDGHKGYLTVGLYPDGQPGELFITVAKEGSTLGGIFDCFGLATSIGLQYGVPLSEFIDKFTHVRFEPMGFTKNKDIKIAKSIIDYIFRWLAIKFTAVVPQDVNEPTIGTLDAPICGECGQLTTRVGACFLCYNCGTSGGCS